MHVSLHSSLLPGFRSSRKPKISSPFSPRLEHLLVSSRPAKASHQTNARRSATTDELRRHAIIVTEAILTGKGWSKANTLLSDKMRKRLESQSAQKTYPGSAEMMPSTCKTCNGGTGNDDYVLREAAVDKMQMKVWVVVERAENEHVGMQWVEMIFFDDRGKVCEIEGCGRQVRLDHAED